MKVIYLQPNLPFVLLRYVMRAYVKQLQVVADLSNRKLCTLHVDLISAYDHIYKDFLLSSIRNRFPRSDSTEYLDLIDTRYRSSVILVL